MITSDEYRAEILKIAGFALITPAGNVFLSVPELTLSDLNVKLLIYFLAVLVLMYFGIISVIRGYEITIEQERRIKKWTQ